VLLNDRTSGATLALPDEGAVISERLASLLGLQVGDTLDFTATDGGARSTTVAGITEMYMGHFMFMSREAYEACYGADFSSNADLVRLCDGSTTSVEDESAHFMDLAGVRGVVQNTALEDQINTVVTSLDMIMTVLIVVATLLGIVIMYNLTNLNVSERMRELSTIKVLGFHTNEATMYIYRETIALTALGLLAGYALGVALHEYILVVVPPDEVMFNPALSAIEFAVPAAVVAAITVVLYFVVVYRLRHVDMLEALKSVE
jgi:putative ABC transport system permease protein